MILREVLVEVAVEAITAELHMVRKMVPLMFEGVGNVDASADETLALVDSSLISVPDEVVEAVLAEKVFGACGTPYATRWGGVI